MEQKPIEIDFPIEELNKIADKEAKAKRYYRPIYTIHKWWARRLGSVFRTILLYTLVDSDTKVLSEGGTTWRKISDEELQNPWLLYLKDVDVGGKVVLDPFMGGGTTIVEGLRLKAKMVGKDLNPVAWFVVKKEVEPVDLDRLKLAFERLEVDIADEIKKYYKTICPFCLKEYCKINKKSEEEVLAEVAGKLRRLLGHATRNMSRTHHKDVSLLQESLNELMERYSFDFLPEGNFNNSSEFSVKRTIFANAMYYFWIKELSCQNCGQIVPLFKGYMMASRRSSKTKGHWILCPECGEIFTTVNYREDTTCPSCKNRFNAKELYNAKGAYYYCPHCGQKDKIVENIQRNGKPKERLYAVEFYCADCEEYPLNEDLTVNGKSYKKSYQWDKLLYQMASIEYESVKDNLPIPQQRIPKGDLTYPRLLENHKYIYWKDMFNHRQLLGLGKLLNRIKEIEDENVKEIALLAFSNSLDLNNMLTDYNKSYNKLENMFGLHAYYPNSDPTESNAFGIDYGRGSFSSQIEKVISAKEYNRKVFEKYREDSQTKQKQMVNKIEGRLCTDLEDTKGNVLLFQGDSSYLEIPDESADFVITDPPYFDNVMYSELSDFFYVWLRETLKDRYPQFQAELTPKTAEIVKNKVQGKDTEDFLEGLKSVFSESHRKLKDQGLMVFTYHHREESAWGAVLSAILNSGFYISAIYPIQGEMSTSTHIINKANVEYDMIVICRKRTEEPEQKVWSVLEDEIYFRVEDELERLEKNKSNLSPEDLFVVTIGKCLESYSKYYPNVVQDGKPVGIDSALSSIREIVDSQLMHTRFNQVARETDELTAVYLFYLAGKTNTSYQRLNKALNMRSIDVQDVINAGLVEKEGSQLLVYTPRERSEMLSKKRPEELSCIDKAHYIDFLRQSDKILELQRRAKDGLWNNNSVLKTFEYLIEEEKDMKKSYDFFKKL